MISYNRTTITQQDRCQYLNDVGGCMITGDCNARTFEQRAQRLCGVEIGRKRK